MQEIRFHGRGGQGTVVASILLAKAFFKTGYFVQSFPVFGVERRGAPVEAYLRLDTEKILLRCNVTAPDHVVVQDARLLNNVDVTSGLKTGGWVLINSPAQPADLSAFTGYRLAFVDATAIAVKNRLGTATHPIINTAMIGAFARMLENPPLETVAAAIGDDLKDAAKANIQASRDAYDQVVLYGNI
jgi:2-oxoacid:acceptor oxidoreductase gamma subunit (pyruvate/2-ketoisovalerate family)